MVSIGWTLLSVLNFLRYLIMSPHVTMEEAQPLFPASLDSPREEV